MEASHPLPDLANARCGDAELIDAESYKDGHHAGIGCGLAANIDRDARGTSSARGGGDQSKHARVEHRSCVRSLAVEAEHELRQVIGADAQEVTARRDVISRLCGLHGLDHRAELRTI